MSTHIFDSTCDAVVLGGGPTGSTTATLLAKEGHRVVIVERERHPRFHVGESLLPYSTPLWKKLGVWDEMKTRGMQRKWGAAFVFEPAGVANRIDFERGMGRRHPMAYQVRRSDFDEMLLRNAERRGVEVREECTVDEVLFADGRAVGVRTRDAQGAVRTIGSRVVVDASGRDTVLGRQLGLVRRDPALRQAAMFSHWQGASMGLGRDGGDILIVGGPAGWYWLIPLNAETTSVGVVFPGHVLRGREGNAESAYHDLLGRSTTVSERLAGAKRIEPVRAAADFSYRLEHFAGDGWVTVGDAAAFLDPVFSSGVHIGGLMAQRACAVLDRRLRRGGPVIAADFAGYERYVRRALDRFRRYILAFYDPAFVEVFTGDPPLEFFRAGIVSVLAGGIFDRDPRIWLAEKAFFLAIERERRLGAKGRKALPPGAAFDGDLAAAPQ